MRFAAALILSMILPGTGHLFYRRYLRGVVLAVLFAAGANALLVSQFLASWSLRPVTGWIGAAIAGGIWIYAVIDIILRHKSLRSKGFQTTKDDLLRAAQVAWLRDEFTDAERLLREILRLDERDTEAWVHLGKILKALGRQREARMCFRSALNLDANGPWRWMLREELGYDDSPKASPTATA